MNNIRSILLVISMLFLAGCAASWNSIGNTANSPASSEQEYQEETVQECAATTEEHSKTQQTGDNVLLKQRAVISTVFPCHLLCLTIPVTQ